MKYLYFLLTALFLTTSCSFQRSIVGSYDSEFNFQVAELNQLTEFQTSVLFISQSYLDDLDIDVIFYKNNTGMYSTTVFDNEVLVPFKWKYVDNSRVKILDTNNEIYASTNFQLKFEAPTDNNFILTYDKKTKTWYYTEYINENIKFVYLLIKQR